MIATPLFVQALFLVLRNLVPESSKHINLLSRIILTLIIGYIAFFDSSLFGFTENKVLFLPLLLELLFFSVIEEFHIDKPGTATLVKFSELSLLVLILMASDISYPVKVCILIGSYFVDIFRSTSFKGTKEANVPFCLFLLSAILSLGLLYHGSESPLSKVVVMLLVPLNYFLAPFSLIKNSSHTFSYSLGQRVFSILLFTVFSDSLTYFHFDSPLFPFLGLLLIIGIFNRRISIALRSGKLSVELLLLACLMFFPNLSSIEIMPIYYWLCFFLSIPYLLVQELPDILERIQLRVVALLLFIGVIPGPFYNMYNLLISDSKLTGTFSILLGFFSAYTCLLLCLFIRIITENSKESFGSRFSLFNSIFLLSSIIIGLVLSI